MHFAVFASILALAALGSACGGDDDAPSPDAGPRDGAVPPTDGGTNDDGGVFVPATCADYGFLASGEDCGASCVSFMCDCPDAFPRSIASCTADGCLVGGDCRAVCGAASLGDALDCVDVYTIRPPLLDNGSPCAMDAECLSGVCSAPARGMGVCTAGAIGDPCADASDCASRQCESGMCADWPIRGHGVGASDGENHARAVVVNASGKAYILGRSRITTPTPFDDTVTRGVVYLLRVDVPSGGIDWIRTYFGSASVNQLYLALAPDGDLVMSGDFSSALDLPGGTVTPTVRDVFVLRVTPDGDPVWGVHLTGAGMETASGVAVSSDDVTLAIGQCDGAIAAGAQMGTCTTARDLYALAIDGSGAPVGLHVVTGTSGVLPRAVTALPDASFAAAGGTSTGSVMVGGITVGDDDFVARIHPTMGVLSAIDPPAEIRDITTGSSDLVFTGRLVGGAGLGGGPLGGTGTRIFVAGFDVFAHDHSALVGDGEDVDPGQVASRAGQDVVAFRFVNDAVPRMNRVFGAPLPMSRHIYDYVVVGMDDAGALARFTILDPIVADMAFAPDGSIVVVGDYEQPATIAGVTYMNDASADSFFLILEPY